MFIMVDRTRILELSLGDTVKKVEANEDETVILQRRSIRVNKNLPQNHIITADDIFEVRPCPIDAFPVSKNVIGKSICRDISVNEYLKITDVK